MIPQTLLWVGLIVAWLVVLVPMLAARHPKVNQVSDATLKTRLLHRGGSASLALRRKVRPTATVSGEAGRLDDEVDDEAEDAIDELDEDDEVLFTSRTRTVEAPDAAEADAAADEVEEAHTYVDTDVDDLPEAGPLDGDTVEIVAVRRAEVAPEPARPAPAPVDDEAAPIMVRATAPAAGPATAAPAEARDVPADDDLVTEPVDVVERPTATVEPEDEAADETEPGAETEADADALDSEPGDVPADEALTEEVAPVVRSEVEHDDADDAPLRRRGGFDPENDARLSEARYRSRQRVTMVLGVLAVVALGAGLMNVPYAWYGLGAVVVALVLFLSYLRRTVRIEAEIRRRRMARLERARREREREAEVRDGIPAHLRRGGCVVMEIDDEDPAFDHLPRYRAEEFDFLQDGGRDRRDLHEPMERKVG
ncbi:gephyrin-like molybdotransferase receptor GlpR [Tsukamurella sp. 1534]|uniref:divisome protein SepX/GlpR n=1 Tax=Tsukamurella sp. 1534 TaxID=1151061 RepID=UPI0003031584|nr:gephyrin-like molybdotransferase receptor GlpR [Tsukamurella sp. 1534]